MNRVTKMSAENIFRAAVKGNNFITPDIIRYEKVANNVAVELSEGTFLNQERVWGVTVAAAEERDDGHIDYVRRRELNKLCHEREEAEKYISQLKNDLLQNHIH